MGLHTTGQINSTKSGTGHKYKVTVLGSERPLEDAGGWESWPLWDVGLLGPIWGAQLWPSRAFHDVLPSGVGYSW